MPNEKNLIPFEQRTESEQRKIRSAGGVASGVSRRRKRSMREAADLLLSLPVKDGKMRSKLAKLGLEGEDIDHQMAVLVGMTLSATEGNAGAAKFLADLLGEDAKEDTEGGVQIIDDL